MSIIRVTKRFHFEMAHALHGYDGLCKNIHGHSYNLEITLVGQALNQKNHPKDGMVLDFSELKNIVKKHIVAKFDHALMINSATSDDKIEGYKNQTERLILVDFQPTTENIVAHIAEILQQHLPINVSLYKVRLYETVTSYAEWVASDNE